MLLQVVVLIYAVSRIHSVFIDKEIISYAHIFLLFFYIHWLFIAKTVRIERERERERIITRNAILEEN